MYIMSREGVWADISSCWRSGEIRGIPGETCVYSCSIPFKFLFDFRVCQSNTRGHGNATGGPEWSGTCIALDDAG